MTKLTTTRTNMIIEYNNGDKLIFPNIPDADAGLEKPVSEPQWVRNAKGNWVRETL